MGANVRIVLANRDTPHLIEKFAVLGSLTLQKERMHVHK